MGKPLMLQAADAERIEILKKRLDARTKIDVVRLALDLLERDTEKVGRVTRWRKAARMVGGESQQVLREFQRQSRLRRLD